MINCPICNNKLIIDYASMSCWRNYRGVYGHFICNFIDNKIIYSSFILKANEEYSVCLKIIDNIFYKLSIICINGFDHNTIYEDNIYIKLERHNFYNTILDVVKPLLLFI